MTRKVEITVNRQQLSTSQGQVAEIEQSSKGTFIGEREQDFLPRRRVNPVLCSWIRRWSVNFEHYRVWSAGVSGTYNGTLFSGVTTNMDFNSENMGASKGPSLSFPVTIIEAFDVNALPLSGALSITVDQMTGACTISTPTGSHSVTLEATSGFAYWRGAFQFRNYNCSVYVRRDVAITVSWTANMSPHWVPYTNVGGGFTIQRAENVVTKTGFSQIQPYGQALEYHEGSYVLPIPSDCDEATATAQALLARQSFYDELAALHFLRNITFGVMQTS